MAKNPEIDPEAMARVIAARNARVQAAGIQVDPSPDPQDERAAAYNEDDVVLEAGANASPQAHAAAERIRQTRADDVRSETVSERDMDMRQAAWAPASILPTIPDRDGWHFRWVRLTSRGENDDLNVNQSFREGYVPATMEDVGAIQLSSDRSVRFTGGIEIGGLLLCKIPEETRKARELYYHQQSTAQVRGVNNDMLRENDPRMPLLRPSNNTRTTFGLG